MAKLQIIILSLLPLCFGQFSIQGPTDGNRRAQGLKYSQDKGVEYTDQTASLDTGGFSIQGASDGNSDFQIQGATDGNSNFQIQGATDGNSEFRILGPTDGGSQAYLHNYEPSKPATEEPRQFAQHGRAIQYHDPSGHRVNWRSYNRAADISPAQQQYEEPTPRPALRRPSHRRTQSQVAPAAPAATVVPRTKAQPQPQYQATVANINYNPIEKAPPSIQEILQFQAQIPYVNIIPEHLRIDALSAAQAQANKFAEEYPKQVLAQQQSAQLVIEEPPRSVYRSKPRQQHQPREQHREQTRKRRQAPGYVDYQHQEQQQQQLANHKAYRRVSQPPVEPTPHYSVNVPHRIQEILQFQAQIPYDIIANQIVYHPGKPYIPQAAPQPLSAKYKLQSADYQQLYSKDQQRQQQSSQGRIDYVPKPYYNQQQSSPAPINEEQY